MEENISSRAILGLHIGNARGGHTRQPLGTGAATVVPRIIEACGESADSDTPRVAKLQGTRDGDNDSRENKENMSRIHE